MCLMCREGLFCCVVVIDRSWEIHLSGEAKVRRSVRFAYGTASLGGDVALAMRRRTNKFGIDIRLVGVEGNVSPLSAEDMYLARRRWAQTCIAGKKRALKGLGADTFPTHFVEIPSRYPRYRRLWRLSIRELETWLHVQASSTEVKAVWRM